VKYLLNSICFYLDLFVQIVINNLYYLFFLKRKTLKELPQYLKSSKSILPKIQNYKDIAIKFVYWSTFKGLSFHSRRRQCLRRSEVLYRILSRYSCNPELTFAIRIDNNNLIGHAWIVLEGKPLSFSGESSLETFQEIYKI
jgi:hypothetical protein